MRPFCEIPGVRARALAALAPLVTLCIPRDAQARDVAYRAPAECPAAAEVTGRIESTAPRGKPARLAIEKTKGGFHGDVVIGEGDARVVRSFDARSCGALVEALELAVALRSDDGEEAEPASTSAPSVDDSATAPMTRPPADRDAPSAPASAAEHRTWTLGTTFSYSSFSEARSLIGGALFADLALPTRVGDVSFLQPSLRASLGMTFPNTRNVERITVAEGDTSLHVGGGPRLTIVKSALDVCPVGVNLEGSLSLSACGRGELGALFADVSGTAAKAAGQLWMAAGPVVRSRLTWSSGSIRPAFEVTAGLLAPLRRDRFHFDPNPNLTETAAPWLWTVGFGGGLVFP